ncbi:Hypothetical predicted protein [Paramuricea clavata]|uniref:Uncharacterized protein n=1 Tax=Paramuricea clavata TaxID=317549 RepID=A0A6S7FK51_PARCT|nr:Hypothetical predicted protein [Paramuricea clavata]
MTSNVNLTHLRNGTNKLPPTTVIHPIVAVKVGGMKTHSYVSARLVELTQASEVKKETRRIATLMGTSTSKFSQYDIRLESVKGNFELEARVTKIEKSELLSLENSHNYELIKNYAHLRDIELVDVATKQNLALTEFGVLGANEYAKIRTSIQSRIGRQGEPITEHTRFGWAIMAPGLDSDDVTGFLAVNS